MKHLVCATATVLAAGLAGNAGAQPRAPVQWALQPLFTIGESSGVELQRVVSVLWLPNGRLLVADAGATRLLVFDSTGRALGAMGRDGSGPAEYRTLQSLALLGDTIAVQDQGNARIGLFSQSGSWLASWPLPPISGPAIRLYRPPGHELYGVGVQRANPARGLLTFVRYGAGGPRDTLLRDKPLQVAQSSVVCNGSDKGLHFFSSPWTPRYLEQPGPERSVLSAMTTDYRIVARSERGDTVASFSGTAARLPISDAEWKQATGELESYRQKDKPADCNPGSIPRPDHKPAIRAFFWSGDGKLWVERYDPKGFAFDVFDAHGVLLATLSAPDRVSDVEPHIAGSRLALVSETPDGAHLVRAYRIVTRAP